MGATCSGLGSRRRHCVTQCVAKPSSIFTIPSRAAKYGRPRGPRHARPPSATRGWHPGDSSAGKRRPTNRYGWSALTAYRRTAARSCSGSKVICRAFSGHAGSPLSVVPSNSLIGVWNTELDNLRKQVVVVTRDQSPCGTLAAHDSTGVLSSGEAEEGWTLGPGAMRTMRSA